MRNGSAPVFYSPEHDLWSVTKYADVVAALKDTETFASTGSLDFDPPPDQFTDDLPDGYPWQGKMLVNCDPPEHTRMRKLAQMTFTPKKVAAMEPDVRKRVDELVEGLAAAEGPVDFMAAFANPLPLRSICSVMGVPDGDIGRIRKWTEDEVRLVGPVPIEERIEYTSAIIDFVKYIHDRIEEKRANPDEGLLSGLVHAEVEGDRMTTAEIVSMTVELFSAGNDTTANLIGHMMMYLLADERAPWLELQADPTLVPAAIEESLRVRGSTKGLFRMTTRDVELGGATIPECSRVQLLYAATGRDEEAYPDPARFDLRRESALKHLAFGRGTHFCLGAPLARLQARIALETLLERVPDITLIPDQELDYVPSMTTQTLLSMRVDPHGAVVHA